MAANPDDVTSDSTTVEKKEPVKVNVAEKAPKVEQSAPEKVKVPEKVEVPEKVNKSEEAPEVEHPNFGFPEPLRPHILPPYDGYFENPNHFEMDYS